MNYSISIKDGQPVALLIHRNKDPETIYLRKGLTDAVIQMEPQHLVESVQNADKKIILSQKEVNVLIDAIQYNSRPKTNPKLQVIFDLCMIEADACKGRELVLGINEELIPLFELDSSTTAVMNFRIEVIGQSGAGKSTWANMILSAALDRSRGFRIYLFSSQKKDESLDEGLKDHIERMPVDMPIDYYTADLFEENSWVIFDDCDSIEDEDQKLILQKFRNRILEIGRHKGINVISISHTILGSSVTRVLHSETQYSVIFPGAGMNQQIADYCKRYLGMSPDQIKRIFNLKSQWIMVKKTAPMSVMFSKGYYLLR